MYPLAHAAELAVLELLARRALKAEQEKLPLEVDHLLLQLFRRHGPDLLQLLLPLRHRDRRRRATLHWLRRRRQSSEPRRRHTTEAEGQECRARRRSGDAAGSGG